MRRLTLLRLSLAAAWALAVTAFFRYWEITLRLHGLLFWTLVFLALYVAGGAVLHGSALRSRRHRVWKAAGGWTGLVVLTLIAYQVVPVIRIRGELVPPIAFVGALDVGLPVWILVRAIADIWPSPARWVVLGVVPVLALGLMWAFVIRMPGRSHQGPLPPLRAEDIALRDALERHVRVMSEDIGDRSYRSYHNVLEAADYVRRTLADAGYDVDTLAFELAGRRYENLAVTVPGVGSPAERVIVGAHYDTAEFTPGADDNASGVAGALELARRFAGTTPARTLTFVFFPNEEPPFFATDRMGSWHYAARAARASDNVIAMISVESIGYYATEPGSQRYPFPFSLFYPDVGDFIGFVGNLRSRALVWRAIRTFRESTPFPSQGAAAPALIPGVSWSDHQSFWLHGFRAIMITDTAPFRNPNYHLPGDTANRLDFDRMTRVVNGLATVIQDLAGATD